MNAANAGWNSKGYNKYTKNIYMRKRYMHQVNVVKSKDEGVPTLQVGEFIRLHFFVVTLSSSTSPLTKDGPFFGPNKNLGN